MNIHDFSDFEEFLRQRGPVERNIYIRSRRPTIDLELLPRMGHHYQLPRQTRKQAFRAFAYNASVYACIAVIIGLGFYAALSIADEQLRVEAQINQEIWQ